jgi:hypothetical protein
MKREAFVSEKVVVRPTEFGGDNLSILVSVDEVYPDFSVDIHSEKLAEIPSYKKAEITREQWEWITKTEAEHRKVQEFLANLYGWRD